jgi:hypothetical protein
MMDMPRNAAICELLTVVPALIVLTFRVSVVFMAAPNRKAEIG